MKKRVLLVDDDLPTIAVTRQVLSIIGYEVLLAKNGIEAIEIATSELPDLVIMDIRMPHMDGLEATRRIRENPKSRSIPILAATAKTMPGDKEQCLASGCDAYLAKPFTYRELKAAIEKLLDKKSA